MDKNSLQKSIFCLMTFFCTVCLFFLFCFFCFFPLFYVKTAFASDFTQMINILSKIANANTSMEHLNFKALNTLEELNQGLMGTHHYGSLFYDKSAYSWGDDIGNLDSLLSLYKNGGGSSQWLSAIQAVAREFPINEHLNSPNELENEYYRLQAETTLASRSSSQVTFDQVAREARALEHLQAEIDRAKDNKSAMDLNNRLSSEAVNVNIQQTKLLALLVQQVAMDAQEKANRATEDAQFFNYH